MVITGFSDIIVMNTVAIISVYVSFTVQGDSEEGGAAASMGCGQGKQVPFCLWHRAQSALP